MKILDAKLKKSRMSDAFSLLEVAVAMGIFFMAIFVILELTNNSLHSAYLLKNNAPDPRSLLGDLMITNSLEEISESGDFGDLYPDYRWERLITRAIESEEVDGLFQVDVRVYLPDTEWSSELTMLLFKPPGGSGYNSTLRPRSIQNNSRTTRFTPSNSGRSASPRNR